MSGGENSPETVPPPVPPKIDVHGPDGSSQVALPGSASLITQDTDLASLTPAQISQLTQDMLDEVASNRPLITPILPIEVLRAEYENGSGTFVKQIDYLRRHGYTGIRRTRGDGDCFYRSLAYAFIDRAMQSDSLTISAVQALSAVDATLPMLKAAGFQDMVYEDWYDVLASLIRQIIVPEPEGTVLTPAILLEAFQSDEVSNCVVVFLRLVTSARIRTDPNTYSPFLFNPETGEDIEPRDFCERYVEAVGKEADHVQITALTRALNMNLEVAYLDGRGDEKVNFVQFFSQPPEEGEDVPVLLYRPGHYDILERKSKE